MAKEIKVQILSRNAPAADWTAKNPTLGKGEIGIEIDTNKFKIGDGITNWNNLQYVSSEEAEVAVKLKTARTIGLTGDATGSTTFDGTANKTISVVLTSTGVTAGTYTKLTVDAKGRVLSATQLTAADIPTLTLNKITDAGTAASKNVGTASGQIPVLDSSGKLDSTIIPAIAITDTFVVESQTAMLALAAQVGDVAVRTDVNKSFILKQSPSSTLANWQELLSPPNAVLSVNGKTGAITLTTADIAEGSNKYYTEARATANFNTNFANKSSADLSDGASILKDDITLILNGGDASGN